MKKEDYTQNVAIFTAISIITVLGALFTNSMVGMWSFVLLLFVRMSSPTNKEQAND